MGDINAVKRHSLFISISEIVIFPRICPVTVFASFLVNTVIISMHQGGIQGQDVPGILILSRWCHFLLQQRAGEISHSLWISALSTETAPLSKYLSESAYYTTPCFGNYLSASWLILQHPPFPG